MQTGITADTTPRKSRGFLHSDFLQSEDGREIAHQLDVVAIPGISIRHQSH